jgi:hypothetical protein
VWHGDRLGTEVRCPDVALFDDETLLVEPKQRDAGNGLDLARLRRDRSPPLDGGTIAVDDRLAEPALGRGLVLEGPGDVLANVLARTERMREEDRAGGVDRRNGVDIRGGPRLRPDVRPTSGCLRRFYFATSIARDSRITITFT